MHRLLLALLAVVAPAVAQPFDLDDLSLVRIATGLSRPVSITHAPGVPGRLYITQQPGSIVIWEDGVIRSTPFLNISNLVTFAGEQGLLGIAFHPNFPTDTRFYLHYNDVQSRVVIGVGHSTDGLTASGPITPLLTIPKPATVHNGGQIVFGPDGKLYASVGDGSLFGDSSGVAENLSVLLGKILRLEVDGVLPLEAPADNPYANDPSALSEIWHYGLRNPWRFSFDRATGDMYIGDVGELRREEINFAPAGVGAIDYGWSRVEGSLCFHPPTGCDPSGTTTAILEYAHDTSGRSVTGGYVYRGSAIPLLNGYYIYGDFVTRELFVAANSGGTWSLMDSRPTGSNITTFGEDLAGELYFADIAGNVFQIAGDALNPCAPLTVAPLTFDLGSGDQTITIDVQAPTPTCTWTASTDAGWMSFNIAGPISGSGSVTATLNANAGGGARTASILINGSEVTVSQAGGASCAPVLNTDPLYFDAAASAGHVVDIALPLGCPWGATDDAPWLTITSGAAVPFSGSLTFDITANATQAERLATIQMPLGVTLPVIQRITDTLFADVPPGHFSFDGANKLYARAITTGCATSPLRFCPDDAVTRGQIAVFIVRALLGTDEFVFPTQPYFTDVPTNHPFFKWIQKFRELGYTTGCGPSSFCPEAPVTREQVAVFLVRAAVGPATEFTYPETAVFLDAGPQNQFFPWIQKLSELSITGGCGPSLFCPSGVVTRGQMALFIIRGIFGELLP